MRYNPKLLLGTFVVLFIYWNYDIQKGFIPTGERPRGRLLLTGFITVLDMADNVDLQDLIACNCN